LLLTGIKRNLQDRVNRFFRALKLKNSERATDVAFLKARNKLKPELFKDLSKLIIDFYYKHGDEANSIERWQSKLIYAIDATYLNLPDTQETRTKYFIQECQHPNKSVPMAGVSVLYDCLNEIVINAEMENIRDEQQFIYNFHYKHFNENSIVTLDRCYAHYGIMSFLIKHNCDFVIRLRNSRNQKEIQDFIDGKIDDEIVKLNLPESYNMHSFVKENNLPNNIKIRLVKVVLNNGEKEYLATTLLDQKKYMIEDFQWLYNKRWRVETYFDEIKNKLEIERFSSTKLIGIQQDFYIIIFLSNLESILTKESNAKLKKESFQKNLKYNYKANKNIAYSTIIDFVIDLFLNDTRSTDEIITELQDVLITRKIPERQNRRSKRNKLSNNQQLRYQKYKKKSFS